MTTVNVKDAKTPSPKATGRKPMTDTEKAAAKARREAQAKADNAALSGAIGGDHLLAAAEKYLSDEEWTAFCMAVLDSDPDKVEGFKAEINRLEARLVEARARLAACAEGPKVVAHAKKKVQTVMAALAAFEKAAK